VARDRLLRGGEVDKAVLPQLTQLGEPLATVGACVAQPLLSGVHQGHMAPVGRLVEVLVTPAPNAK
jgi:hypothetical protein